jgi:hypothetical protein
LDWRIQKQRVMKGIIFMLHDRPGLYFNEEEKAKFVEELRALASLSLSPLPNYQCFSSSPDSLNDKIIITAHQKSERNDGSDRTAVKGDLVAFTSAVMLQIHGLEYAREEVFHTGLTVVDPSIRRQGLLVQLFMRLLLHICAEKEPTDRVWVTSLAEIPNSLVHVATFMAEVFPSPQVLRPSGMHLLIARAIAKEHRNKMLISPTAVFDEENFVFQGSNDTEEGRVFLKDADDPQYWHRNKAANDYYRSLLRNKGDEVLQVSNIGCTDCSGCLT